MCRLANGGGGDCCGGGGGGGSKKVHCHEGGGIGQEEYEEDHADEERMFLEMDSLLSQMRARLNNSKKRKMASGGDDACRQCPMCDLSKTLKNHTANLSHHLFEHLKKEEVQCMPLVEKHLTRQEIYDLVGNIMGKRSSSIMTQILTMAVQNLSPVEREDMVRSMKQAMVGTFFESWLSSSGCWGDVEATKPPPPPAEESEARHEMTSSGSAPGCGSSEAPSDISQAELEKLIRSVAANPNLTALQKSTTIQGLRDSVWKSGKKKRGAQQMEMCIDSASSASSVSSRRACVERGIREMRTTPPSAYYKVRDGQTELVWSSNSPLKFPSSNETIPKFSSSELALTHHDGATGAVLGCPHYARSNKLRHPASGRLYTCRLCCEQDRENPLKDKDSPLDRYAVTEVLCMRCNTLQPASAHCIHPSCPAQGKPFASHYCGICNFYDDDATKKIYHCPFCNVCRSGLGLGIDYRHCMRCNACVSLSDSYHTCIPQSLQGNCPICHDSMFESTEPLRGLKCGHVMHLSCFSLYIRGQAYTCPLCKKSVDDMKDYFSVLDAALRMQPMPEGYSKLVSNIYCQDCGKYGKVKYHFVGCKCSYCGSYNTREIERSEDDH